MKKIAILLTSTPESGGEHQYLVLLMEALIKYNNIYFEVTPICCNRFWRKWCQENQVEFVRYEQDKYVPVFMKLNARFYRVFEIYNTYFSKLGKIIIENKINLLIGGQQSIFLPALPCKLLQPVHDLMHRYEAQYEEIGSTYEWRETYFSCEARIADAVLVDSQMGKKQYRDCYYKRGRHFPRIKVLPFAVSDYKDKKEEYIETPAKYVFYPAQFWEHKNHGNLILAINLLKEKLVDIHLILVGADRNSKRKVEKLIRNNGLDEYVSIRGFVSDRQIIYLYRHAVALVMPTCIGPTNIPPLEAMALGCPVIVSNKYAMPEQVGEAGLLCDPNSVESIADCIEKVWTNEELRLDMIRKGYQQSQKWSEADFKKRFIKIVMDELTK